jgi:hypothetical protein
MQSWRFAACGLAFVLAAAYWATAQEPAAPAGAGLFSSQPAPNPVAQIESALKGPIGQWEFIDTPLNEIVAQLKSDHNIEVQLDTKTLDEAGVTAEATTFSRSLSGLALEDALALLLDQHEMTFVVRNGVLQITTQAVADEVLETRLYDVGDLLNARAPEYEKLIEVLVSSIEPESWDQAGGPGAILEYSQFETLVVTQTRSVHQKMEKLLGELRKAKKVVASRQSNQR